MFCVHCLKFVYVDMITNEFPTFWWKTELFTVLKLLTGEKEKILKLIIGNFKLFKDKEIQMNENTGYTFFLMIAL